MSKTEARKQEYERLSEATLQRVRNLEPWEIACPATGVAIKNYGRGES